MTIGSAVAISDVDSDIYQGSVYDLDYDNSYYSDSISDYRNNYNSNSILDSKNNYNSDSVINNDSTNYDSTNSSNSNNSDGSTSLDNSSGSVNSTSLDNSSGSVNSTSLDNSSSSVNSTSLDNSSGSDTSFDLVNSSTTLVNSSVLVNSSNLNDSIDYSPKTYTIPNNSSIGSAYIQQIINDAIPGSTILFTGSFYKDIYLKINKALNIISKSGTVINSSFRLPVFTILKGGSGTNISGFTAHLEHSFVEAENVRNISVTKNEIFTKRKAIVLENVHDSKIQKNNFLSFATAIDISKSGGLTISNNNITPNNGNNIGISLKDTVRDKISILNNNITGHDRRVESTGIYFGSSAKNVLVQGNIINEWFTGMDFPNSVNDVSVLNNTFNRNGDGVIINGWINNFTFNKNVVTNTGRVGVLFDYDFKGTKGKFTLEKNFFTSSGHLDLRNTGDQAVNIGENFAKRRCVRVNMKNGFSIKTRQSGNGYYFTVVDSNSRGVKDLPNFSASISINGVSYNVNFVNSMAYIEVNGAGGAASLDIGEDKRSLDEWGEVQNLSSSEMEFYKQIYDDLIKSMMEEENNDDNVQKLENKNGTGSIPNGGNGGGDSGISDGRSSVSSNADSSAASAGSADMSVSAASSAAPSAPADAPDSTSVKSLSLDEETFRVAGVGGLIFLIICVIGLYYREDIIDMINKGNY